MGYKIYEVSLGSVVSVVNLVRAKSRKQAEQEIISQSEYRSIVPTPMRLVELTLAGIKLIDLEKKEDTNNGAN